MDAALAKSPSDTLLNEVFAPEDRAVLALRRGQPLEAIKALGSGRAHRNADIGHSLCARRSLSRGA
jgi:hypothetical protein